MNIKLANSSTKFLALLGILSVIASGCSGSSATVVPSSTPTPVTGTYWPTEAWRTSTPKEQGMDAQKLEELIATIQERNISILSFRVIRNGYIVSETYFASYKQDTKHDLQSVGRSWTSVLIGIAIDKGYITGRIGLENCICRRTPAMRPYSAGTYRIWQRSMGSFPVWAVLSSL